jgi:protein-disulfide isomerase
MRSHAHQDEVRRDFRRGIQDGVNGTPTIFLNGLRYDGPRDYRALLSVIESLVSV